MTGDVPAQDPFAGVKWNHELFVWDDPRINASFITRQLLGSCAYWNEDAYRKVHQEFGQHSARARLEIERKILFDAGRQGWGGVSKHGKPFYRHMLTLIKLMFPETDITPSLADAVMLFCMGISCGRKLLNLIGSQNSGKSAATVRIAFALMVIDAEYSQVFVANPFDNAADSTVWGDVEDLWLQLRMTFPNDTGKGNEDASSLFPYAKLYAARQLDFIPGIPKCGSIVLRNVKHVGKFKGSKSRSGTRGVLLLAIDEVNEIENHAFLVTLTNLTSQDAFFGITSQNFKDPEDMGGRLTEPRGTFGGPANFEDLDIELDHFWHSAVSSITLRFDGHKSPNILCGRTIYPRLFKEENRRHLLENYGEQSPDYFSQARSFPVQGNDANSVLNRGQVSASRHTDTLYSMREITDRVAFCDPAFGGRDKAVFGSAEFGPGLVSDGNGGEVPTELLLFGKPFVSIPLTRAAVWNDNSENGRSWFERLRRVGGDPAQFTEGSEITYEEQVVIQCAELCRERGIPYINFGYDFSMRPGMVDAVHRIMGLGPHAFDYNKPPEGVMLQRFKLNSEDCCKNRVAELAFLASDVFISKQVRGGAVLKSALDQMTRTRYETVNKKYVVEDKKLFKQRWGHSPDYRDTLMGVVGMSFKKGFRRNPIGTARRQPVSHKQNAGLQGRGRVFKRV